MIWVDWLVGGGGGEVPGAWEVWAPIPPSHPNSVIHLKFRLFYQYLIDNLFTIIIKINHQEDHNCGHIVVTALSAKQLGAANTAVVVFY